MRIDPWFLWIPPYERDYCDHIWFDPFWVRMGWGLRAGIGGRWGCIGVEVTRP